jgi:phosphohistidine swiveling domain-containing protein
MTTTSPPEQGEDTLLQVKTPVGFVSLKEEKEAAELEKKRPTAAISTATFKRVQRVHELKEAMAPLLAEMEDHKIHVFKEMDKKGVDVLTRRNMEVVSRDETTSTSTDVKGLEHDFPEIAGLYIKKKKTYRVNWKNPVK